MVEVLLEGDKLLSAEVNAPEVAAEVVTHAPRAFAKPFVAQVF